MKIVFNKFHGAGNDFILVDNRHEQYNLITTEQIAFICHRHFGIGADGLMFLEKSKDYDFEMKYYNSDGKEGTMCGNGGRCITAFADFLGIKKEHYLFRAVDGLHKAEILKKTDAHWEVSLQMNDVDAVDIYDNHFYLDTGSPHHVEYVEKVDSFDVFNRGRAIRYNDFYEPKGGTNVNFVSIDGDTINVRTYERGVEDETLACGTGATAVAIATALKLGDVKTEYKLHTLGGVLKVQFENEGGKFKNIWLKGPAVNVFSGEINL